MSTPTQEKAMSSEPGAVQQPSAVRRVLTGIGVQNSSLIITLIALIVLLSVLKRAGSCATRNRPLIGTAITIMGLLALVQRW